MPVKDNGKKPREILAYVRQLPADIPGGPSRYGLQYERNMLEDDLQEPSGDPELGPMVDLPDDERAALDDQLRGQGVRSAPYKGGTVYGMQAKLRPDGPGAYEVDLDSATRSRFDNYGRADVDWAEEALRQYEVRDAASEYERNGTLPGAWVPSSALVNGRAPTDDEWAKKRDEMWPVRPDGQRQPLGSMQGRNADVREVLAYLTEKQEPGQDRRYSLQYERNMKLDSRNEPSAHPELGPEVELSAFEADQFEDRMGYMGVESVRKGNRSVYGLRSSIEPGGEGMDAVDWVNARPSIQSSQGAQHDWNETVARQDELRFEAAEYDARGTLPQTWTPASSRVDGNRPDVETWKNIRDERWPVGEDGRRRPAETEATTNEEQSMVNNQVDQGRTNSQAGLAAHQGGARKSLPSVPPPGQPGSRFNPIVRERPRNVPLPSKNSLSKDLIPESKPEEKKGVGAKFREGLVSGFTGTAQGRGAGSLAADALTKAGRGERGSEQSNPDMITEVPPEIMNQSTPAQVPTAGPAGVGVESAKRLQMRGPGSEKQASEPSKSGLRLAPGAGDGAEGPEREAGS